MTLADALRGSGNLDLLRLIAALAVVISHAWPLALGPGTVEPLATLTGRSLGGWALVLFFFLSGFLILQSAERRGARTFWLARVRRILPGLSVALLVTLALALASGGTPDAPETARYLLRGLSLFGIEHQLPGAFSANPYPRVVNGPLWSLQYEVAAYAICFVAARMRGVGPAAVLLVAIGLSLVPELPPRLATFAPLLLAFAYGMAAWVLRARMALTLPALALSVLAALIIPDLATLAFCHALLMAAYRLPSITLPVDLSFGVYIYGWPVAQTLMAVHPDVTPVALVLATILCTLPLAWASWVLVERPALHRRALA